MKIEHRESIVETKEQHTYVQLSREEVVELVRAHLEAQGLKVIGDPALKAKFIRTDVGWGISNGFPAGDGAEARVEPMETGPDDEGERRCLRREQ